MTMRFMLIISNQFPVPPEMVPSLVERFVSWWNQYRDKWESAGFFAGGTGGGGICNVVDAAELHRMMNEWPLIPFSQIDVHPLVDMDIALRQWQDLLKSDNRG
jgi:muconolactone delta-isomerase